jgi:hypothetical protein
LRTLQPSERIYTFWDYFRNAYGGDAGLRLDQSLLNALFAPRLKAAGVDRDVRGWEKTSDHAPVWIELTDGAADRPKRTTRLSSGHALPEASQPVIPAADGCGGGRYRGPGGACHWFGRGPYPGGYYGPYRRPYGACGPGNGCGYGWYRGPNGACHPLGRGPFPGGYYGPYHT